MTPRRSRKNSDLNTKVKQDLKIEIIEGPEMTPEQVKTIARILFEWWRRDYEEKHRTLSEGDRGV